MAKDTVGSILKVTLDGVTYKAAADSDLAQMNGKFTNEAVVTSGGNMQKKTKRAETVESVDLVTNVLEHEQIVALSQRTAFFPMSYVTADGSVYRATGFIDLERRQTADGKTTIKMIPRYGWDLFAG